MLPGFSGTLLEADLRAAPAPPSFLGHAAGAGAAADPAAFLVDDAPEQQPAAAAGTAYASPSGMGMTSNRASASDLLRQLESGCDFLLPSEPLDVPLQGLLGGGSEGRVPPPAAAVGMTSSPWEQHQHHTLMATSPGTPPSTGGNGAWPSMAFPTIPEEPELLSHIPAAGPHGVPMPMPMPSLHTSLPASLGGSTAAAAAVAPAPAPPAQQPQPRFAHPLAAAAPPSPLFVPMASATQFPAPPPPAAYPAPPPPAVYPGIPISGLSTAGGSLSHSEAASQATSATTSSTEQAPEAAPAAAAAATGGSGGGAAAGAPCSRAVPRPSSMPNLHLHFNLGEGGSGAVRKKAAPRAPRLSSSKPKGLPRSQSHSDLKGHVASAAAAVAATPAAATPAELPHVAFLTPSHMRKGKGGRQPAADPRLDPRIDPKKAARIMANRLSAAKSKLKQKGQKDKSQPQEEEEDSMEVDAADPAAQHAQQIKAVEQQLAKHRLQAPEARSSGP